MELSYIANWRINRKSVKQDLKILNDSLAVSCYKISVVRRKKYLEYLHLSNFLQTNET